MRDNSSEFIAFCQYDIRSNLFKKLQVSQNSAVSLIEKLKIYDSVSEYEKQLIMLPIPARIQSKLMATTWKALTEAPKCIQQHLLRKSWQKHNPKRSYKLLLN